ncbi:MAG: HypC/HybG/HupF family hydrogenase formation chaperone [Candidatus Portnoybacteria bacterium]|nr:HypC/HybG/HupF family hydrogenase formation chaperone [Candidatus Portnoybacteria bacterium]
MCLAIPSKVVKIEGKWANVQAGDHSHRVNLSLLKNIKVGDYIFIHDELAINKIPKTEAKKILKMIKDHTHTCDHHH